MKNETQLKEVIENSKYVFRVYKEAAGTWYANTESKDDPDFFIYKWTWGYTKKAVVRTIKEFLR